MSGNLSSFSPLCRLFVIFLGPADATLLSSDKGGWRGPRLKTLDFLNARETFEHLMFRE